MIYAHSKEGRPPSEWQLLEVHLRNVAQLAREFGDVFDAGEIAYWAGLWHDIGKCSPAFQAKLLKEHDADAHIETKAGRVDHSTPGAQFAAKEFKDIGKIIAYAIAGHHAGIPDGKANDEKCLERRLSRAVADVTAYAHANNLIGSMPSMVFDFEKERVGFQCSFLIRMIYSCLVDADFLDTERFLAPERAEFRKGYPDLDILSPKLFGYLEELANTAPRTAVNERRQEVLASCLSAAELAPGFFSLTVPTGGGKTLSSLAFAMKHAQKHRLRRIIYTIPFTSIIEQNADVFRSVLGEDTLIEHHSNFEPGEEDHRSRLAAENWDAHLIVTTNVQLFESLFSNRSSRCRRLHRLARSVIILDEAQSLPSTLLRPCLEALRELVRAYGATIVLCTATQPALSRQDGFSGGIEGVREIIKDPVELSRRLKRVDAHIEPGWDDKRLSEEIEKYQQILCVVNTRTHARRLYECLQDKSVAFHLSALMCPVHRSLRISEIKKALKGGRRCRVVSTQLIEAGVDIDFPVVLRALAGLDSLAQAAGRCNREGRLEGRGRFVVFRPRDVRTPQGLRQAAETAEMVIRHHEDPLIMEAVLQYFKHYFWQKGNALDAKGILQKLSEQAREGNFPFREVAGLFRMIEDVTTPVIIPYNQIAEDLIQMLKYIEYPGSVLRRLQRYAVSLYDPMLRALLVAGSVEQIVDGVFVLRNRSLYRDDVGLCPEDPTYHAVEDLIF
ncbi:MAG: CRISPR-associated helicase Cas3' [Proteobacteria bacterium]|nr:CRISPR-associated helicase Cas3' [Pseudomonadota bacterium]